MAGCAVGQDGGGAALRDRAAGDDDLRHPRRARPLEHGLPVGVEAVVRQVGADVDQVERVTVIGYHCRPAL